MKENIEILSKKCKNKSVVFYCIGNLFEEIYENFNLNKLFNIKALCDIKFESNGFYKGFPSIPTKELKDISFEYLIIVSPDFDTKEKFLKENNFLNKKTKILNIQQKKEKINSQKKYEKIIKNFKNKEKLKVLFICEQNEKWSYTNLYKAFKNDEKFEVLPVALFPITSKGEIIYTQEENKNFFNNLNIDSIDCFDYEKKQNIDIKTLKPDIVFYQQPWYLNNCNHPKFVSDYALTIMSPYGYTTLSEKNWGSNSTKEIYQNLWLFFAESPYHVKFYKKAAKMKNNLVALGSLKLDNYLEPIKQNPWKNPQNLKIIYAPHHSLGLDGLKMSTFDVNYKNFLDFAKNNQNYSFVFKPHPMLKNAVVEHNLMTKEEYENYSKEWQNLKNSSIYNKGEYFDLFKTSDILITDCSSFLAEYYPTKKPIIFLNRKDRAPFDSFGEKLKKGFYEVQNFNEIENLIKEIIKNDKLFKTREKTIKKEFFMNDLTYKKIHSYIVNRLFS